MLKYYVIDQFLVELEKLEKKRKNNYYSVRVDVCNYFIDVEDISTIISRGDIIQVVNEKDQKVLIKTRIPISSRKEGARGGFRLISIVDKFADTTTFLSIYPKTGKLGKTDLTEAEYLSVLREYVDMASKDALLLVDIEGELAISVVEEE